jgi:zinc protease
LYASFRSSGARMQLIESVERFGWDDDYPLQRLAELQRMDRDALTRLAERHWSPAALTALVVGDAASVAGPLSELGWGEPERLDIDGRPVDDSHGTD